MLACVLTINKATVCSHQTCECLLNLTSEHVSWIVKLSRGLIALGSKQTFIAVHGLGSACDAAITTSVYLVLLLMRCR